jgi:hypothetical protein
MLARIDVIPVRHLSYVDAVLEEMSERASLERDATEGAPVAEMTYLGDNRFVA